MRKRVTLCLGLGVVKTKSEPEKSWMRVGRVVGWEANQRARSDLYGTLCWHKRSEAICWSSGERCGSSEAVERNDRMSSVVDTTSPVGFWASPFIFWRDPDPVSTTLISENLKTRSYAYANNFFFFGYNIYENILHRWQNN